MNPSTSHYCLENEQEEKEISVKLSSESYEKQNETWKNLSGSDRQGNNEIMKLMTNMHATNVSGGFSNQEVSSSALIDSFFCFKQACRLSKNPLQSNIVVVGLRLVSLNANGTFHSMCIALVVSVEAREREIEGKRGVRKRMLNKWAISSLNNLQRASTKE